MLRNLFRLIFIGCLLLPLAWVYTSIHISTALYDDIDTIPYRPVGLLLGTSQYTVGWGENLFYTTRIEAAKMLYEKWKISHILISWDNSEIQYNEPESMKRSLVKAGIPEKDITLDYAGFRTLDSVLRARDIFGVESYTIISQTFHTERALYLARANGIDAIGYGAADISLSRGLRVYIREIGARWIAIYDVLTREGATVWGWVEKIYINTGSLSSI